MPSFLESLGGAYNSANTAVQDPQLAQMLMGFGNALMAGGAAGPTPGSFRFSQAMQALPQNMQQTQQLMQQKKKQEMEQQLLQMQQAEMQRKVALQQQQQQQAPAMASALAQTPGMNPMQQGVANAIQANPQLGMDSLAPELLKSMLNPPSEKGMQSVQANLGNRMMMGAFNPNTGQFSPTNVFDIQKEQTPANFQPFKADLGDREIIGSFDPNSGSYTINQTLDVKPKPQADKGLTPYQEFMEKRWEAKDQASQEKIESTNRQSRELLSSAWRRMMSGESLDLKPEERQLLLGLDPSQMEPLEQLKREYTLGMRGLPAQGQGAPPVIDIQGRQFTVDPQTGDLEDLGGGYSEALRKFRSMNKRDRQVLTEGTPAEDGTPPMIMTSSGEAYYIDGATGALRKYQQPQQQQQQQQPQQPQQMPQQQQIPGLQQQMQMMFQGMGGGR